MYDMLVIFCFCDIIFNIFRAVLKTVIFYLEINVDYDVYDHPNTFVFD